VWTFWRTENKSLTPARNKTLDCSTVIILLRYPVTSHYSRLITKPYPASKGCLSHCWVFCLIYSVCKMSFFLKQFPWSIFWCVCKATTGLVMSFCLVSETTWHPMHGFAWKFIVGMPLKFVNIIHFWLKLDKSNRQFTQRTAYTYDYFGSQHSSVTTVLECASSVLLCRDVLSCNAWNQQDIPLQCIITSPFW
jgi:hypothetical protein